MSRIVLFHHNGQRAVFESGDVSGATVEHDDGSETDLLPLLKDPVPEKPHRRKAKADA